MSAFILCIHGIPKFFLIFQYFLATQFSYEFSQTVAGLPKFSSIFIEKNLLLSGPSQFKLVLLKGQLSSLRWLIYIC